MNALNGALKGGLNGALGYTRLDLRRTLRDRGALFFIVVLPVFMYLVFGVGGDESVGSGNVAMYVTISMAAYGAVTATTSIAGQAAQEQQLGWGRLLALTPMRPVSFLLVKAAVAMSVAAVPVLLIYLVGAFTGARAPWQDWLASGVLVWLFSGVFVLYGLAVCLIFRGPNAVAVASGAVVLLAFLGNVFIPLEGTMLAIARFTPLYGYAALARYPLTDGWTPDDSYDPLWLPVVNVAVWTVVFTLLALWGLRRSRSRV